MYFLKGVDYLFGTKLENSDCVLQLRNAHAITTSTVCGLGLLYSAIYNSYDIIPALQKTIALQCFFDMILINQLDLFLHHCIALSMAYFSLTFLTTHGEVMKDAYVPSVVVLSSELSTIFLVLLDWFPTSKCLQVSFSTVFLYTRVYLLLRYYFFDASVFAFARVHLNASIYAWNTANITAFVAINLYWSGLVVKKIYKKVRASMASFHTHKNSEYLLQFTYVLNPFISLYVYRDCSNPWYYTEIASQCLLAMSSYCFHRALHKAFPLSPVEIDLCQDSIIYTYIADIICIQLRTFMAVTMHQICSEGTLIYYMAALHSAAVIVFLFAMANAKTKVLYNGKKPLESYGVYLPLAVSIGISYFSNNNQIAMNHLIVSCILMLVNLTVIPFYEMNHLVFHLISYYQSYAISSVNASLCKV